MKLLEFVNPASIADLERVPNEGRPYIKGWVNRATQLTADRIIGILHHEADDDPDWFLYGRKERLRQLISEILTIKLLRISNYAWSDHDFIGQEHSEYISHAIDVIYSQIHPEYIQLYTKLMLAKKKEKEDLKNQNKEIQKPEISTKSDNAKKPETSISPEQPI